MKPETIEEAYRTHKRRLTRLCRRWSGHRTFDADDLLAETTLRLLEMNTEQPVANPLALWTVVIRNAGRDIFRAHARGRLVSEAEIEDALPNEYQPDDQIDSARLLETVIVAFGELSGREREALGARAKGDGYASIAKRLNTSVDNARQLVASARAKLRHAVR